MFKRRLRNRVVVITGASSGIGRATALAFARRRATVVLAARREQALREVAAECTSAGGQSLVVPTDVAAEAEVEALARTAVELFGKIDIWINNAGVALYGRSEEVPLRAFRQVMETNFYGCLHGARAALPIFRKQEGGLLINIASMAGLGGQPYMGAYVASKFAVRGLGESLRMEVQEPGIRICTVLPASVDTPLFQHGANYTGRAIKPLEPLFSPEAMARVIVDLARRPRREVIVGPAGRWSGVFKVLAPGLYERAMARRVERDHFQDRSCEATEGNLFSPMEEWASVEGGWGARSRRRRPGMWSIAGVGLGLLIAVPGLLSLKGADRGLRVLQSSRSGRPPGPRLRRVA